MYGQQNKKLLYVVLKKLFISTLPLHL